MMNVSRNCSDGSKSPQEEPLNQSQLYITTAGYKNTYAYDKLIQVLVQMIVEPEKAYIMGGTWRVPAASGLISRTFIQDLKNEGTFDEATFGREYKRFVLFKDRELLESPQSFLNYNINLK